MLNIPNRRAFIGAAVCGSIGLSRAWASSPLTSSLDPFSLGVASGDPAPDGFVLWTRLAPAPLATDGLGGMTASQTVHWQVFADEGLKRQVASGEARTDPRLAHSVHIEVEGLRSDRPYWYRFTAMGVQSPVGRARTSPMPGARLDRLRFNFASCSHYEVGYFGAYGQMAAEQPDLTIFLGDYIYEYSYGGNRADHAIRHHDRAEEVTDLTGYRNRYALYKMDRDLQALHHAAPCLMTWDDHEVENDYANVWSEHPSTPVEVFRKRREAAYQAFYEHMPLRRRSTPHPQETRVYDRIRYGDLAEFTVLDGRQYRTIQPCALPTFRGGHVASPTCTERTDPTRTMLGFEQEHWLFDQFKTSSAKWNLITQDLLVAAFKQKDKQGAFGHWTDGWDGYPACRQRVLDAIDKTRLRNPIFIGGDSHAFWVTDLKADFEKPESKTIATEFIGTSITSDGPAYQPFMDMMPDNPHIRFFDSRPHGYVSVDLTPERMETKLQVISDRRDPKPTLSTLKTYVVESGKAGVVAA